MTPRDRKASQMGLKDTYAVGASLDSTGPLMKVARAAARGVSNCWKFSSRPSTYCWY
jgi:hypothetical protein